MIRWVVVSLLVLALLGAAVTILLLRDGDGVPFPSERQLRNNGFAVWPEDTVDEAMEACEEAESWRLDPKETAFRFVREVLDFPQPSLNTDPIDPNSTRVRYLIGSGGVRGVFLGSVVDVRKYDRCWFVVGVQPREGGAVANLAYVNRSGRPHVAIDPLTPKTEVGYGSRDVTIEGTEQVLFDLSEVEPDATGHVMSLSCRQVCDAAARPLGYALPPATTRVAPVARRELASNPRICRWRSLSFKQQLNALAALYAISVTEPVDQVGGRDEIGGVLIKSKSQLASLGVQSLHGDGWSFTIEDGGVELEARIPRLEDCWHIISVDDPARHPLKSLRIGEDAVTFELRWGKATSAEVDVASLRGSADWEGERLPGPMTVQIFSGPVEEPFWVSVALRDPEGMASFERFWYRTSSEVDP